jgi:hypothetical protein
LIAGSIFANLEDSTYPFVSRERQQEKLRERLTPTFDAAPNAEHFKKSCNSSFQPGLQRGSRGFFGDCWALKLSLVECYQRAI